MKRFAEDLNFDSELNDSSEFKSSISSDINHNSETQESVKEKCVFCTKLKSFKDTYIMLNKALYLKYSSSQNYYYSKEINDLVENEKKPHVIHFKLQMNYENEEENLTRYYNSSEFEYKLSYLTEYYKFHKEVPRLFMLPISHIMNNFHDKKRRIEYFKIKKMLNEQNKGVITNHDRNERESIEEIKSSIYSDDSEKNQDMFVIKNIENSSKILELLDISSQHETRESQKTDHKQLEINENHNIYDFYQKKEDKTKNSKEMESITLEELNFYLNKIPDCIESEENQLKNGDHNSKKINFLPENFTDFECSEVRPIENENSLINKKPPIESKENSKAKETQRTNPLVNLKTDFGLDSVKTEEKMPKALSINNKKGSFNKRDLINSCKAAIVPKQSIVILENNKKPPNNLKKALKQIETNSNKNSNQNKNMMNQCLTFRDLSKNMQIFNKLIEKQKNLIIQENRNKSSKNTKSHRIFNSIDFNILNNKKSLKQTPKNALQKIKTGSLSNFQNFLHPNKEKLNEFIQSKLNFQSIKYIKNSLNQEKHTKNSSSNSIKKSQINTNAFHRRIVSFENGKLPCYSAKNNNREKNFIKNNVFQSAIHSKKTQDDLFQEKIISSPKPILTMMSECSPNKHLKHFKPMLSPTVNMNPMFDKKENAGVSFPKKSAIGLRKLNMDEKIYMKKNRVKPKSFQLQLKTNENDRDNKFNDYKMKDFGTSKNTSINSKASGNITSNSRNEGSVKNTNNFNKISKGCSSTSLKYKKKDENERENTKNQQMKINIISNFFNFNNGLENPDKDTNPIYLKLKNEFSNMKNCPNYKFLDINLTSKVNKQENLQKKSKIKIQTNKNK